MNMTTFGRYWLYPLLWLWTLGCIVAAANHLQYLGVVLAVEAVVTVGVLLLFEWRVPLKPNWGMTKKHFFGRDLYMVVINGAVLGAINYGLVMLAISTATTADGVMAGQPLWQQIFVGLAAFEALQYSVHRFMHTNRGIVGRFLWRAHAIHHLPQQLYVVMHAVFHPVNALFVRILVQLTPIWIFGFDTFAVFVYGSVIALHGTVSHLNVDMRLGPLNYLFVGPELHRYHHSANTHEAKNFAAAISLYDLAFGTFHHRPGQQPASLGLAESDGYPGQHAPLKALAFPFLPAQDPEPEQLR